MLVGQAVSRMAGQYMVVSGGDSPNRIKVFDIETVGNGTYTIVNNVASLTQPTPTFTLQYRWHPQGTAFVYSQSSAPRISVYEKVGNTYTKVDLSPEGNQSWLVDWNPSYPQFIVALSNGASNTAGQFQLFEKSSTGTNAWTSTGTIDVAITATIAAQWISWNPQGTTVAMGMAASPWLLIYNFNPVTKAFTKIVSPSTGMPTGVVDCAVWNYNGSSLMIAGRSASNKVVVYNREGDVFVKASVLETTTDCYSCAWGGDLGEHLAFGPAALPRVKFAYRPPGTTATFHLAANPSSLPANNLNGLDISADGKLAVLGVYLNANKYYRRDPATTSTWIDIGQNISGNPVYGKSPHIFPGKV